MDLPKSLPLTSSSENVHHENGAALNKKQENSEDNKTLNLALTKEEDLDAKRKNLEERKKALNLDLTKIYEKDAQQYFSNVYEKAGCQGSFRYWPPILIITSKQFYNQAKVDAKHEIRYVFSQLQAHLHQKEVTLYCVITYSYNFQFFYRRKLILFFAERLQRVDNCRGCSIIARL